jgi:hypothetical protein
VIIKKTIKTENETYLIDCEFNQDEFDSILEIGLNVLLAHGALPFQSTEEEGEFEVLSPSSLMN